MIIETDRNGSSMERLRHTTERFLDMNAWNGKPYHSFDHMLKERFSEKVYKVALNGGMTCPNRDGTLGNRGCIFCSAGGSGDFAENLQTDVWDQIEAAKKHVSNKTGSDKNINYIAYFQSFTNTYGPVSYLKPLFERAISHPDIAALSIATRPDCLGDDIIDLLKELNSKKPVWVELGLQTIHDKTAHFIRRGYELPVFENALNRLKKAGLTVIVHVILGLPGETTDQMKETVKYLADQPIDGIKLQLLHILKGTDLADIYQKDPFHVFSMEEYIDLVIDCITLLPPRITIHRITGDGPKNLLIAPLWSGNKRLVLNQMHKRLKERGAWQGQYYLSSLP